MKLSGYLVSSLVFLTGTLAANNFGGLTASNSAGGKGTYTCRTQAQWNDLAKSAKSAGFKSIRILGFDCNALNLASAAAASAGIQVLAGIYFDGTVASANAAIDNQVKQFQAAVKQFGANRYMGLTVGNENTDSPTNIMNKVSQVKKTLQGAGINTPVTTVHVWVNIRDNHVFCNGDFVGANAHAFYDPNTTADHAGDFMTNTVIPALRQACGQNKKIIITETGWPSRGGPNRAAVASLANERTALSKLNCAARNDRSITMFAFEYDDQTWKSNDNERSFGIFGKFNLNTDIFSAC
ncbi:glycoside hydrolase family 17 protein [Macrolepiota fuliginosa MF-IS2]|uniref:glucan endo-1,3-beta-D-glucosidase n=1 Tax=Macrolepiota fuliginosa MF-IS2 TaxID=1400762 RepID=A0A9P5X6T9_9AGAR|nr:glycoside hydrolase family 17 protein [Macrolepiota fuliginosa MF-IS2]